MQICPRQKSTRMKKFLLFLAVLFSTSIVLAQGDGSRTIDAQDSVIFNLAQQSYAGGYVKVPVYIASDDTVNSLDFSFSYNTVDFTFDSVIDLASLSPVYNEVHGGTDTTVLLTSFSLQPIPSHTGLIMLRFIATGPMCSEDLDSILVYLNGDACTSYVTNCITIGIANPQNTQSISGIYPNPVSENTTVEFSLKARSSVRFAVNDVTGKTVYETNAREYGAGIHKVNLNLAELENGIYIVRLNSDNETSSTRISVIR